MNICCSCYQWLYQILFCHGSLEDIHPNFFFIFLIYCRDAPLYLEWAPSNVLMQTSTSKNNEKSGAIGENDAKRQILEQHLEGISDVDIDPDRVEV